MDERLKKVTTVTVVTTVVTTSERYKHLIFSILNHWLQPLQPFSYLYFILITHSVFNRILHSYFFLCVELENYRNGCNQAINKFKINYLHSFKVVTTVVTVVTKSHNYL